MTTTHISTAARRIAKTHNERIRGGFAGNGKLVFGRDGAGGAWYSDSSVIDGDYIVVTMRQQRITAHQAQEIIEAATLRGLD